MFKFKHKPTEETENVKEIESFQYSAIEYNLIEKATESNRKKRTNSLLIYMKIYLSLLYGKQKYTRNELADQPKILNEKYNNDLSKQQIVMNLNIVLFLD